MWNNYKTLNYYLYYHQISRSIKAIKYIVWIWVIYEYKKKKKIIKCKDNNSKFIINKNRVYHTIIIVNNDQNV